MSRTQEIEDFRANAHRMVDWMADYLRDIEGYPVRSQVRPGEVAATLPAAAPGEAQSLEAIMADFERDILPGITHWQHPNFFAYFPANSSPPSVLAEMLMATIGAQCMLWQTSPAATEMETRVLDWVRQLIGLPTGFHGVIQDSASSATLCALLTARERATGWSANEDGLAGHRRLTVYCSAETHSSIEKDVKVAGLGRANLRKVATGDDFGMDPAALEAAIEADREQGAIPACAVATLGTTGIGAMDPLRAIAEVCRRQSVYLHVDAAWAGSAFVLPEYQHLLDGIEYADSFVFNPHKWMFTNFDCSAHFVRQPEELVRTLEILPEYLKTSVRSEVIDYRDWSVPLGRRFRALKLWFVLRSYGVRGIQARIAKHIELAADLERWMQSSDDFELLVPRSLSLLNFRYRPGGASEDQLEALNTALLAALNDSGQVYLTQNRVNGRFCIRFNVGGTWTEREHVERAWDVIQASARALPLRA